MMVAMVIQGTGSAFVDGGIIGGPPRAGYDGPVYYVSGPQAAAVDTLSAYGLKIGVLDAPVGAASALKMSYAGITKGLIAVGSSMILAAHRAGAFQRRCSRSCRRASPNLIAGFSRSIPPYAPKGEPRVADGGDCWGFAGKAGRSMKFTRASALATSALQRL